MQAYFTEDKFYGHKYSYSGMKEGRNTFFAEQDALKYPFFKSYYSRPPLFSSRAVIYGSTLPHQLLAYMR